jgi:hypothetical protein
MLFRSTTFANEQLYHLRDQQSLRWKVPEIRFIGVAAGPPVIAILMDHTGKALFYILCGISLLAVLSTFMAIKPDEKDTAK